ncbi:hypothetical protein F5Y04DRAFT_171081 [Hypomontagnella monticulosa]|nr:hypothetical protein F5Y04DRAFT_171081 [Hypomontagnella monticulosa]
MEALVVVGLVGNIITFLEFGAHAYGIINDIRGSTSGATEENEQLRLRTQATRELIAGLSPQSPAKPAAIRLGELSDQGEKLSQELLDLLKKLERTKLKSKFALTKATWNNIRYYRKKTQLASRLDQYKHQVNIELAQLSRSENEAYFHDLFEQGRSTDQQLRSILAATEKLDSGIKAVELSPEALRQINSLIELSNQASASKCRRDILEKIEVNGVPEFSGVNKAHSKTFSWLLNPDRQRPESPEETNAREDLVNWLCHGDGIFHISGKPGSGKSTLMRLLCEHPTTTNHLKDWAGDKTAVLTHFFFRALGTTPMQRSMSGLKRSLLHATLCNTPDIVHELFPGQWSSAKERGPLQITDSDIATAFDALTRRPGHFERYRLVFFIDGLDEYEGDSDEMVKQLFQWVESNPEDIKICVSSRELLVFQERFRHCRKLRMHKITYHDIEAYVKAKISANEDFKSSNNQEKILQIAHTIIHKAEGVFLWVEVVIRGLLEGLLAEDRLEDLEQKVNELPPELEDLFNELFNQMLRHKNLDRTRAMRTLQLGVDVSSTSRIHPLFVIYYSFLEDFDNLDFDFGADKCVPEGDIENRLRRTKKQLRHRCFGLLEVVPFARNCTHLSERIRFIHRSVLEFLSKERVWSLVQKECEGFDGPSFILECFLATLVLFPGIQEQFNEYMWDVLWDNQRQNKWEINPRVLEHIIRYSIKHSDMMINVSVMTLYWDGHTRIFLKKPLAEAVILAATRFGFYEPNPTFVHINTHPWVPKLDPVETLAAMLGNLADDGPNLRRLLPALDHMLKNGASPNACLQNQNVSIWMHLMCHLCYSRDVNPEPIIRLFLLYGAGADMFLCLQDVGNIGEREFNVMLELEGGRMRCSLQVTAVLADDRPEPLRSIINMSKKNGWRLPLRDWITCFCHPDQIRTLQFLIDLNLGRNGAPTNAEIASLKSDESLDLDFEKDISIGAGSYLVTTCWRH